MDVSHWLTLFGLLASCSVSGIAVWFASKANKTAHDAFRYTTGMVWQLLSYEQKAKTPHGIVVPLAGKIFFGLSALGTQPVRDIKLTFSYDPNHLLTSPYQFFAFDPREERQLLVKSGLETANLFELQQDPTSYVLIEWLDVAGERRSQKILLKDIKRIDTDFEPPEYLADSDV